MVPADAEVAHDREGHAIGAMAKVFCGEILFDAVVAPCRLCASTPSTGATGREVSARVGVFPLYDAGNIGMQMRKIFITEDNVDTIRAAAAGAEWSVRDRKSIPTPERSALPGLARTAAHDALPVEAP